MPTKEELEAKLAAAEQRADVAESLAKENALAKEKAEAEAKKNALAKEKAEALAEASKAKNPNAALIVEGSFKSKVTEEKYAFKLGNVKVRKKDGSVIDSKDALKDEETMEWLVKIGSNVLEVVK